MSSFRRTTPHTRALSPKEIVPVIQSPVVSTSFPATAPLTLDTGNSSLDSAGGVDAPSPVVSPSPSTSPFASNTASVTPLLAQGIKSWTNGLGLVSSGHRQLDDLLGGGLALGTVTAVECDQYSTYAETLQIYGLAESLSHGHETLVLHPSGKFSDVERFAMSLLPYNQHAMIQSSSSSSVTTTDGDSDNDIDIRIYLIKSY